MFLGEQSRLIKLLQCPTCFCVHNLDAEAGFLVGLCFVNREHQDPCILIDTETGIRYQATIGENPGVYYEHQIEAVALNDAIPIQN